jgi:Protein of unknown function (DUF3631)
MAAHNFSNLQKRVVARYDYRDEHNTLLFQVVRFEPKTFAQRRPDGRGGFIWGLDGVRRVLYRLPQLLNTVGIVYVTEGEKDADRLTDLGLTSTCNPCGAGSWRPEFAECFEGRDVVILPDNDGAGLAHADDVARAIHPVAKSVRVVWLPEVPPKGDVSDWLGAGHTISELEEIEAKTPLWCPAQADGAELVRDVESFITRFVILPPRTALAVALWAIVTFCFDAFDALAYLSISSPTPRCGKTRLLEVLSLVVFNPVRTGNVSEAALFRFIETESPTLLLDEAETLRGKGERAEYLRGLLNAGNRRDAYVTRCVGQNHTVQRFSVYCPKVVAGIGSMPNTIRDRSILVEMQRRKDSERVERFLFRKARPEGEKLRERISAFVSENRVTIETAYERIELGFIEDRDAEAWESLFAALSVADNSRFEELKTCALVLTGHKSEGDAEESLSVRVLSDLRDVWPDGESSAFSASLVESLKSIEDSPWASDVELNQRKLARFLRPFGVESRQVRIDSKTAKGYLLSELESAFLRYLAEQGKSPKQSA